RSVAPKSSAPASDVIAPPSNPATTARPSTAAKSNNSALHSVGIGALLESPRSRSRKTTFADSALRCAQLCEISGLVVGKELVDNALDACEEAEVAPDISVIVDPGTIIIQDNAGGIDTETIDSILDYTIRVSSREAYVSPTRGAQGNALKTILAMGYVLDRKNGSDANAAGITIIETRSIKHQIEFRVDHVNNQPKIIHTTT